MQRIRHGCQPNEVDKPGATEHGKNEADRNVPETQPT
jgi:hypothetical protein